MLETYILIITQLRINKELSKMIYKEISVITFADYEKTLKEVVYIYGD